jgi:hypothetical protein
VDTPEYASSMTGCARHTGRLWSALTAQGWSIWLANARAVAPQAA